MGAARQRWAVFTDEWRTELWPLPAIGVLAAVAFGVGLPRLDARIDEKLPDAVAAYLFSGGPEAARSVLSAVAGSLITVTSLTFSLTVVTLQLAGSQYSPRILRTFVRDRWVKAALMVLLGTFTYTLTVLRTVRTASGSRAAFVPQLAVTLAYLLGLASVVVLVLFLAHLARQIRVESMLRDVHQETAATLRRVSGGRAPRAEPPSAPAAGVSPLCARKSGFLTVVDEHDLVTAAVAAGAVVLVDRLPGDSVIAGTPFALAWSTAAARTLDDDVLATLHDRTARAVRTGYERTASQDVAFGLRQIVDVAVRALSPGINDPTTAVHALGHAAAILCEIAREDLGPRVLSDERGQVRVVLRRPDLATLLDLAVAQPRRYGAAEPAVLARLLALLREVAWSSTRPEHRQAVADQLGVLVTAVQRQGFDRDVGVRLDDGVRAVCDALAGRWLPSPPPSPIEPDPNPR